MNRLNYNFRLKNTAMNIFTRKISLTSQNLEAFKVRSDLKKALKIVVKLGTSVITRDDHGLALGRLASIVEQISQLHNSGKQVLIVTSGATAFGKQTLNEEFTLSKSLRDTTSTTQLKKQIDKRACAATGQTGLMSMYSEMFSQYNIRTAQLLVNKLDFFNKHSRENLKSTLNSLLSLKIIPILNTNDAIADLPDEQVNFEKPGFITPNCNDSLAARLAHKIESDLLLIMTNVDGVYNIPPNKPDAHLLHTFNPEFKSEIQYGNKLGIQSKVNAASWALEKDCSVVICNANKHYNAIIDVINGKQIGTFFTKAKNEESNFYFTEMMAIKTREAGRQLHRLTEKERSLIILDYAQKLKENIKPILEANSLDIKLAKETNLSPSLMERLPLNEKKINSLIKEMKHIASKKNILDRVLKSKKLENDIVLKQVTVSLGVLMVIFESQPEILPQICSLAISTGNSLLLKGGAEASNTNRILHKLVQESLEKFAPKQTITLLNSYEEINDLLKLDSKYIDLIIPCGSNELFETIKGKSNSIPVLGHAGGVCHVYIDKDADETEAIRIVRDSKINNMSNCNALEKLLIHKSLVNTNIFNSLIEMLSKEKVKLYSGSLFHKTIKFAPPIAKENVTKCEGSIHGLELIIELVDDVHSAIAHINKYGRSHTESIVTTNAQTAATFLKNVDSACVFHNASTKISDGYQFGLGPEISVSNNGCIHSRGPVGVEGLLSTKWLLFGHGNTVSADCLTGQNKFFDQNKISAENLN